ncbi:CdaR family protein [Winogradskyella alexanderae]|uniref:YbbR-like domain-containing protein n=1 Tax=Winogradskyella alexanderae TaxID=2877123 RepID=A0ABS7XST1_9FLAO|nr:YbbR-like domain-containing protein [Winogradskyella alexanderae]MCA0133083.1 YbbR-like domain-containing protein [Winogradskyella alexanderae]
MKAKISDFLKRRNAKRFSIFFVLAFVFLIFSKLSNDYKQNIVVSIKLDDLDEEIVIENDSLNKLLVYVKAKGFTLVPFLFKDSKEIRLDAKKHFIIKRNEFIFDVQRQRYLIEDQLGKAYNLLTVKPDTLRIKFSKLAFKYVPVEIRQEIKYGLGYDLVGELNKNVDSVKIVGAESKLDTIHIVHTEVLNLSEVNTNIKENLNLDVSNFGSIQVSPEMISVNGVVERFTEGNVEVPVIIKNVPSDLNINYFPKTVSVVFYVNLNNFNQVKPSDFKVECDFMDITQNKQYLVPKVIDKPNFVKRAIVKQNRIDFIKL